LIYIYIYIFFFHIALNKESIPREIIFEISAVKGLQLEERYLSMLAHILSFFVSFFFLKKEKEKEKKKENSEREKFIKLNFYFFLVAVSKSSHTYVD